MSVSTDYQNKVYQYDMMITESWLAGKENLKEIWAEIKPEIKAVGDNMPVAIMSDNFAFIWLEDK